MKNYNVYAISKNKYGAACFCVDDIEVLVKFKAISNNIVYTFVASNWEEAEEKCNLFMGF